MRRGFTILELLVASLLLGMLMSILTMIFSQSSIAWRTGIASVADMDEARGKIADVRYKADNAYIWEGEVKCVRSIFDENGDLRSDRQIGDYDNSKSGNWKPKAALKVEESQGTSDSFSGDDSSSDTYVVNVKSWGPDREENTYDDIWSFPDDPEEW